MNNKPKMIRMNDSIYKELKLYAVQNEVTLGYAIKKLLEEYKKQKEIKI